MDDQINLEDNRIVNTSSTSRHTEGTIANVKEEIKYKTLLQQPMGNNVDIRYRVNLTRNDLLSIPFIIRKLQ